MKFLLFISCFLSASAVMADVTQINYHLGKILVEESEKKIILHTDPLFTVSILPGGKTWPNLSLDENGLIYAGNVVIDPVRRQVIGDAKATLVLQHDFLISEAKGGFEFRHKGKACYFSLQYLGVYERKYEKNTLKNANMKFSSTENVLLALVKQFDKNGESSDYLIQQVDFARCAITYRQNLGNPDLLVELNQTTEGGWWITGSIEQTLLQSSDGYHWRKATLPEGLSSLISAYVVNPWEIWLAAVLLEEGEGSPYLLVYSKDGGVTWRNVVANDPILQHMPVGWLEGQKRRVLP